MSPSTVYPSAKRKTFTFTDARFKPYATAVGQASLAWNYLHEMLGALFSAVAVGAFSDDGFAIWYSSNFDRLRREMLKAAISRPPDGIDLRRADLIEKIEWMLLECDELEERRNDIMHATLMLVDPELTPFISRNPGMIAYDLQGIKLAKADILYEFKAVMDSVTILARFSSQLYQAWTGPQTLPKKPRLPSRGIKKS